MANAVIPYFSTGYVLNLGAEVFFGYPPLESLKPQIHYLVSLHRKQVFDIAGNFG